MNKMDDPNFCIQIGGNSPATRKVVSSFRVETDSSSNRSSIETESKYFVKKSDSGDPYNGIKNANVPKESNSIDKLLDLDLTRCD